MPPPSFEDAFHPLGKRAKWRRERRHFSTNATPTFPFAALFCDSKISSRILGIVSILLKYGGRVGKASWKGAPEVSKRPPPFGSSVQPSGKRVSAGGRRGVGVIHPLLDLSRVSRLVREVSWGLFLLDERKRKRGRFVGYSKSMLRCVGLLTPLR
ncbi:hypothetical protein KM043_010803 [Ampulex compressa]|nr:hypothetical protein KM043_010803 [Ampulex compressa]